MHLNTSNTEFPNFLSSNFIFYQAPPRIHALLLCKPSLKGVLWHKTIFPQTCNFFNKLLWEIVTLATKPLFFYFSA